MCKQFFESFAALSRQELELLFANKNVIQAYLDNSEELYTNTSYVAAAMHDHYVVFDKILNLYAIVSKANLKKLLVDLNRLRQKQIVVFAMDQAIEKAAIEKTMNVMNAITGACNVFYTSLFNEYANISCNLQTSDAFKRDLITRIRNHIADYTYEMLIEDFAVIAQHVSQDEFDRIVMFA